jgi:pyruvate dehydrogenase E1 component alpha subunit
MSKSAAPRRTPRSRMPDPYEVGPLGLFQLVNQDGQEVAPVPELPKGLGVRLLEAMLFQRALDQRMLNLQRQGRIGFYGTAKGQEGAVLGSGAAFESQDWLFPALREGAIALWRGMKLEHYVSQCFGNSADPTHGRQMPCHYSDGPSRYVSLSSPIGTQITHAAGAARAIQVRGEKDQIVGGYLGDGATSSNDFHAGMNFAGVWKSPIVYVCQNNQWAISVPAASQTASETFAIKAEAYGMPGLRVDGNDVLACYVATKMAADRARRGEGPTFIECLTFRMGGHSSSDDPTKYRDESVAKEWAERDPLLRHRKWLVSQGAWSDEQQEEYLAKAGKEITKAIDRVEAAGPVDPATLFTDVWTDEPAQLLDQQERLGGPEPV